METDEPAEKASPEGAPKDASAPDDAALDLARGDVTDDDLATLEQAVDQIDFATRRATPERLARLRAIAGRLSSLADQVEKGVRTRDSDSPPLSDEDARRYEALVSDGVTLAEKGDLETARTKLEAATKLDPDEPYGLFNLGVLYGRLAEQAATKGDFYASHVPDEVFAEKAVFCYERVLELEPENARALTNLAAVYDLRGETELAKEALKRALAIDPSETKAQEHLADLESSS
ncbi:tetratricopeptide repeat protein [bacterium]|nr:tetratricopeptide repeat protein [bacterium]